MRKHIKIVNTIFMILLLSLLSVITVFAYTDQELCDMALQHYYDRKGSTPSHSVIDSVSGNSVTIHLYNVDGNHTTTYDWYTVDRVSGAGTNLMGEPINLSPYAPAPQESAATDSAESQDTARSEPVEEPENTEKPEETDENNDTDTNTTEKPDDGHKAEDDAEETDSSSEKTESTSSTALTATQNSTSGNSSTKNILLAIVAISAISGIIGIVILRCAKPIGKILCPSCGATNMSHANFCTQCGKPIEHIGIKWFLQCFNSTNTACRVGSWIASLSIIVFLASAVSVVVLPKSTSEIDTPIIADQDEKESIKTAEPSYEDYLATGREQLAKKDFVQAEESFQKAIELEPEQIEAYQCLIDTYVGQEDMEKTAEVYKDAVKIINDNYSATHSLLDDDEELYLNAIDFFESQDDEKYAFQLVADLLNMASDQNTVAKLEEKQNQREKTKRYAAYKQLLVDYTTTYGEGTATGQGYNSYLSGLCFAKLIDFNQDGDEELLLAYYDAEKTKGIWVHEVEVWAYNDGELLQVFANQSLSDGGMSSFVALSDINGKPCISTGTLGMPSKVSMWGYTGEQFTEVGSINYDPGVQYIVNGTSVTIEECQSALSQWENEITKYWLVSPEQDGNLALTELNNTQSALQNLTATTAQQ